MPQIFLSYARDDVDEQLITVINQLRTELVGAGIPKGEVFFKDNEAIQLGQEWSPELARGVGSCKLFLAIYSPTYFTRPYCGREWAAFNERIKSAENSEAMTRCLMPLWWRPVQSSLVTLPEAAARLQDDHSRLPPEYKESGLRALKMTREEKDYNRALFAIVALIVEALKFAKAQPELKALPPGIQIEAYANAFAEAPPPQAAVAQVAPQPARGLRKVVRFAIAAGTRDDMQAYRDNLDAYDDDVLTWRPYAPDAPIFEDLLEAATKENFAPELATLEMDLHKELAGRERQPIIIVADPWSVRLGRYRSKLEALDTSFSPNLGACVPSPEDQETPSRRAARDQNLWATFPKRLAGVDQDSFCYPLGERKDLVPALRKLITVLKQRILKTMQIPTGGDFPNRPKLGGPGSQ